MWVEAFTSVTILVSGIVGTHSALAEESPGFSRHSISISGNGRAYLLRLPRTLPSGGAPVVILLHGHGGNAEDLVGQGKTRAAPYQGWLPIADQEGLVLIAPEGLRGSDRKQGWNDCRGDATTNPRSDDVAFLLSVVDAVGRDLSIDRHRVFVAGTSNGGHMALRMAIERPEKIAGAAAVVAAMPAHSQCAAPTKAVPVLFMNGSKDPLLPFAGGQMAEGREGRGSVLSAQESVDIWLRLAGVSAPPEKIVFRDSDASDDSRAELLRYTKNGVPVVALYRIDGGGHTEPSRNEHYARFYKRIVGAQNGDIEMAEEIWKFFSAQQSTR